MAEINGPLDTNGNVKVSLPTNAAQAGFSRNAYLRGSTSFTSEAKITQDGELYAGLSTRLFESSFNGALAGALANNQWNQQQTTMGATLAAGFLRFNPATITTLNTGVSINSWNTFVITDHNTLKLSAILKHQNGAIANKQFDLGFGYYDIAGNQNATMNEFVGFRWTQTGQLQAIVEASTGGAPVAQTLNLTVQSDSVSHIYETVLCNEYAEFWIDGICVGVISAALDGPGLTKSNTLPVVIRLFNGASSPSLAPVFDLGDVTVTLIGPGTAMMDRPTLQRMQGRDSHRAQGGIQGASGNTGTVPTSGTTPTGAVNNNVATSATGTHGYGRAILTNINATAHTEYIFASFGNPAIPETAGQAIDARSLVITDIMISPLLVTTAITGGGFQAQWFIAYGHTALSIATLDAVGGAAVGTKSAIKMPLPMIETVPAAAAVGTISTRTGEQGLINLTTPILIQPGEFVAIGLRTLGAPVAITAGTVDYGWDFNGYWQ